MLQVLGHWREDVLDTAEIRALLMDNGWIMNESFDSVRFEMPYKTCAMRRLDDKKMPHVRFRVERQRRRRHQWVRYLVTVASRDLPAPRVVVIQVSKLYAEACGLQLIDAAVGAAEFVNVLACRAVVTEQAHAFGQRGFIGGNARSITHRAKVLGRIEAEAASITKCPNTPRAHTGAVRLGRIFE